MSETATGEILSFFPSAPITLKFIEGLVQENTIDLKSKEKIFDISYRALKENPSFTTVLLRPKRQNFKNLWIKEAEYSIHGIV